MWELDNTTDYAAARNWYRDRGGLHHWLVAVRATFDILPDGRLALADEQPEPLLEPEYRGDPATTSLLLDADLLAHKPGTDIILDASAYAPGGVSTERVDVSLHIGPLSKTLVVYGPRVYRRSPSGPTPSSPRPFTVGPIQYEWAFGGSDLRNPDVRKHRMDDRNPVGKGVAADPNDLYDQPAHTIEYPEGDVARVGPAGFGAIASSWSPRRERAGTYDARWETSRKPLLPDDYDPAFALSAPADQWLRNPPLGGESVFIRNMTPNGVIRFDLPAVFLRFETMFGVRSVKHQGMLSTIFIVPDARTVSLVWQSALQVPINDTEYLDFTRITEELFPL